MPAGLPCLPAAFPCFVQAMRKYGPQLAGSCDVLVRVALALLIACDTWRLIMIERPCAKLAPL